MYLPAAVVGSPYSRLLHHCQRSLCEARRGKAVSLLSRSGGRQMTDELFVSVTLHFFLFILCCSCPCGGHGRSVLGEWPNGGGGQREGSKTLQRVCWQSHPQTRLDFSSFITVIVGKGTLFCRSWRYIHLLHISILVLLFQMRMFWTLGTHPAFSPSPSSDGLMR